MRKRRSRPDQKFRIDKPTQGTDGPSSSDRQNE
jgi:hypothetical protein